MPASYPTSAKIFTTKSDGAGNTILAAHVNDLQSEVTAIEQDLLAGSAVARGGTGNTTLTANRVLLGNGTSAIAVAGAGTSGQVLTSNGASAPTFQTIPLVPTEQTTTATGAQNNFDLTARFTYLRCTGAAPEFSGFTVATAAPQAGDTVIIDCLGTTAKVTHQDTNSTEANRIICPSTNGQIVGVSGRMVLVYDTTTDRWREALADPGAPITYTPTWTGSGSNPAIGNGTLTGRYTQRGTLVWFRIKVLAGGTTTFGTGTYEWSLPMAESDVTEMTVVARILDNGTANYIGIGDVANTGLMRVFAQDPAIQVAQTSPMTWASGDLLIASGEYQVD